MSATSCPRPIQATPFPAYDSPAFLPTLVAELGALTQGERDWLVNLSNAAALLYLRVPELNWAGFYLWRQKELVLGPFQGNPATPRVKFGKDVCGTAARNGGSLIVPDVNEFPGHAASDPATASQLAIPLVKEGRLLGVLDLQSPRYGRFSDGDRMGLEEFVASLVLATDWPEPRPTK